MKLRLAILLSVFFTAYMSHAQQWTSSGNNFTSGKLGLGTSTPDGRLDIKGLTYLKGALSHSLESEQLRIGRQDLNVRYHSVFSKHSGSVASNYIQFRLHDGNDANGAISQKTVLTMNAKGIVGIGTSSLDISGTGVEDLIIGNGTTSSGLVVNASNDLDGILAFAKAGTLVSRFIYNNESGNLNYQKPSLGNLFTIGNTGNVGIGIDDPKSTLDISSGFIGNANYNDITIGNASENRGIQIFSGASNHSGISFHDANITSTARTSYDGGIYYNHDDNEFQIWANKAQRLTINESGYLGIGDINPITPLSVRGIDTSGKADIAINSASSIIELGKNKNGPHGFIFGDDNSEGLQLFYRSDPNALIVEKGNNGSNNEDLFSIDYDTEYSYFKGNVGIGDPTPQSKLSVNGTITAKKVKVVATLPVPDYVFEEDYELRTLQETKNYIQENKHLPEIPSAKEIEKEGINLGNMNLKLLKKIEELTLYQIELLEKVESLQKEVNTIKKKVK